ncbi:hypothetical protein J7E93_07395 [Streptomyces sp. ISL-36]|uniref:hypothetical protein n=1 Tax=Streptomyces sp. ISL-36 TaxID=2819182 RepID=UPI001BE80A24|nr:hypothetical protein [Streptomyces sp. ISL-36]MBT2439948.1 hypothetical protein [Streptomyces sp. ISL-36]
MVDMECLPLSIGAFAFGGVACDSGAETANPVRTQETEASAPTTPAPADKQTRSATPSLKPGNEREELKSFEIDDSRAFGADRIWVVWTVVNSTSRKANYTWEWEAVDTHGVRVAKGTELAIGVRPGEKTIGGSPTTLETADVKLRITKFDRTAAP